MITSASFNRFREIDEQLKTCREALPWNERRTVVGMLTTALESGDHSPAVIDLVSLLADDPKWEVRSDVASLLLLLPESVNTTSSTASTPACRDSPCGSAKMNR
jgi:hypothetical protein